MAHTSEVVHDLDNILAFITKAESEFRGYLITADNRFMADYDQSIRSTDSTFLRLKNTIANDTVQRKNLDVLHLLIKNKFTEIKKIVYNFLSTKKLSAVVLEGNIEGINKTKEIQDQISKMKYEENALWNERSEKVSEYSGVIQILNILSIIVAVFLTIYSLLVYNKENKGKLKASKKAEVYKLQLQERVTQLAKLNTELIELRRLEKYVVTGRIARVIAHEVRNPLTNINLACEQLHSELNGDESNEMLFNMISRNSERINQLVSDLLNTTRVEEFNFSEVSINKVLDETIEQALDRFKLNQIKLVKDYADNMPLISVDIQKIKIAFLNIIVNAIEAIEKNGVIRIETQYLNGKCVAKISDNGKGMTQSEMDRLFEPYFTTKEKGNGLGLANSQNIILGHEGRISAESEHGKGTTFTITLNK